MNWKKVKLGEICKISKGKKHEETDFLESSKRYIQIEDLSNSKNLKYTIESGVEVNLEDVIIAWDGANAGKVGTNLSGIIGSTLARLRILSVELNYNYFYRYLDSKFDKIKSQRTGATIPHVSGDSLKNLEIPLPPLTTQKHIAEVLDKADALRQQNRQLLQHYDDLLQSTFIELFGEYIKNKNLTPWKPIKSVTKFIDYRGKTPQRSESGVVLITAKNVKFGYFDFSEEDFVSEEEYVNIMTRGFAKPNDVLFTTEGATLGNVCRIPKITKFALGQRLITLRCEGESVSEYIHFTMIQDFFQNEIIKKATGSAVKGIRSATFAKIQIPIPPLSLQQHFAKIVEEIEVQKEQVRGALLSSEELFEGLLAGYFG